jgi:hypothetical protein
MKCDRAVFEPNTSGGLDYDHDSMRIADGGKIVVGAQEMAQSSD